MSLSHSFKPWYFFFFYIIDSVVPGSTLSALCHSTLLSWGTLLTKVHITPSGRSRDFLKNCSIMTVFHTQGCCGSYAPLESAFNSEKDSTFMEGRMNLFLSAVSSDKCPPQKYSKDRKKTTRREIIRAFPSSLSWFGRRKYYFSTRLTKMHLYS